MIGVFYVHVHPWMVLVAGSWGARARSQTSSGLDARFWRAVEIGSAVLGFVGLLDPSLVRWSP